MTTSEFHSIFNNKYINNHIHIPNNSQNPDLFSYTITNI